MNRATTGAVVNRQPFGGWKRSSVGPTAKAGGPHYVDCLRHWPEVVDVDAAIGELRAWWEESGARSRDLAGLSVEANLARYRRFARPVVVRVDQDLDADQARYLAAIVATIGVDVHLSAAGPLRLENLIPESVAELVARSASVSRVRWLSDEAPPVGALLDQGVGLDRRPLAQRGAVEGPRWLLEQSVAITHHRYGNVRAGPAPAVAGLAAGATPRGTPRGPC